MSLSKYVLSLNNRIFRPKALAYLRLNRFNFSTPFAIKNNINGEDGVLALRKIDVCGVKELFSRENKRLLPKDLSIVSYDGKTDEMTLRVNKLNQESSITLLLKSGFDYKRNQVQTEIKEINRSFATAHQPIAVSVEGSLNTFVARLQRRIDKDVKKYC